ncbi:hypothetical protein HNE05_03665 [Aquipseudomonas campi]|uniref:RanBP2-type domain-containing protein n=1 Tax=Aquipseudomonas campi TaxID=2731681 RepID=A0A6M8F8E5_9GAMM|nr:hypothetical protein [Pseudomonas campi]QKE62493.1 hypothetical protein HNE05_03665 [Pseudomonas campi]
MNQHRWQCVHCNAENSTNSDTCASCQKSCYEILDEQRHDSPFENSYQVYYMYGAWTLVPASIQILSSMGLYWQSLLVIALLLTSLLTEQFWHIARNSNFFRLISKLSIAQLAIALVNLLTHSMVVSAAGIIIGITAAIISFIPIAKYTEKYRLR